MKIGNMVRIKKRKIIPHPRGEAPEVEEWWEQNGIVVEEYQSWEKIVTILHEGEIKRIAARDVQLVSRVKENESR